MYTLNCKGKLLLIDRPLVMGILNVTPDSFHDQNLQEGQDAVLLKASRMIGEGADIIDIGGQSTRPGSERVSAGDEAARGFTHYKKTGAAISRHGFIHRYLPQRSGCRGSAGGCVDSK